MNYASITKEIASIEKADQVFNYERSKSGLVDGYLMARLHLLKWTYNFNQDESINKLF